MTTTRSQTAAKTKTSSQTKSKFFKANAVNSKKIKTAKSKMTKPKAIKKTAKTSKKVLADGNLGKFDLDDFITHKLGRLNSKNKKQIISDSSKSSLADLVKFNTTLAHSYYKITDEDSLEISLLSLQSDEDIQKLELSPSVAKAWMEVAMYRDLLMLGDLPTITQERRPYEWIYSAPSLSIPAQVALMTSFITIAIKLTGNKPSRLNMKMPGGRISGKKREEVVSYLAIIQTITDSMNQRNKWEKKDRFANLKKMNNDLNNIINDF